MDIHATEILVEILLPTHWWKRPSYRIIESFTFGEDTVPAGYVSDGATVPRLLWPLFPPVNRYFLPSVLHDYKLNQNHGWGAANKAFREALLAVKIARYVISGFMFFVEVYGSFWVIFMGEKG